MHMKLDSGELAQEWTSRLLNVSYLWIIEHDYAQRAYIFISIGTMEMPSKNHYYSN